MTEPARDVRMEGPWIVQYTDAPVSPCMNGDVTHFFDAFYMHLFFIFRERYSSYNIVFE